MTRPALRVGTWGFFGMGNIGNEGTLTAFLTSVREAHPEIVLSCLAADAEAAGRQHGVPSHQLMSFRADPGRAGLTNVVKAASRVWDLPRTLWLMGRLDALVVAGTGILETKLMPKPWGLPYWLFLAALSCRLQGRSVVLLSVGAELPQHPVTRFFYTSILRLSQYRSFRDEKSRSAMGALHPSARLDPVVPDLAFALPAPDKPRAVARRIGIGVMAFDGGGDDPSRRAATRKSYVESMTRLVNRLVDDGWGVTLFTGDVHDEPVAVQIEQASRAGRPDLLPGTLTLSKAGTLESIMAEMAEVEVVVASRFHNVICALKLTKPTVSLGYAEKNEELLTAFGLGEFTQPIDAIDVDRLLEQIDQVKERAPALAGQMDATLRRFETSLDEQFRHLCDEVLELAPRAHR